jgi:hypothetical protein
MVIRASASAVVSELLSMFSFSRYRDLVMLTRTAPSEQNKVVDTGNPITIASAQHDVNKHSMSLLPSYSIILLVKLVCSNRMCCGAVVMTSMVVDRPVSIILLCRRTVKAGWIWLGTYLQSKEEITDTTTTHFGLGRNTKARHFQPEMDYMWWGGAYGKLPRMATLPLSDAHVVAGMLFEEPGPRVGTGR